MGYLQFNFNLICKGNFSVKPAKTGQKLQMYLKNQIYRNPVSNIKNWDFGVNPDFDILDLFSK